MDDTVILNAVREILATRGLTDTEALRRIRRLLRPEPESRSTERDSRGWVVFDGGDQVDLRPDTDSPYDDRD